MVGNLEDDKDNATENPDILQHLFIFTGIPVVAQS